MNKDGDRSPLGDLIAWPIEVIEEARKFWKTRLAIKEGIPLQDWSAAQLKESGYCSPWKFDLLQTGFCGALGSFISNTVNVLRNKLDDTTIDNIFQRAIGWLEPFQFPLLFTAIVVVMGWASLRDDDLTRPAVARGMRTYLYLDGTFGFYPQLALAIGGGLLLAWPYTSYWDHLSGTLVFWPGETKQYGLVVLEAGIALALLIQSYYTYFVIPLRLFGAQGYRGRKYGLKASRPWIKYVIATTVIIGVLDKLVRYSLTELGIAIGYAIFWLQIWLEPVLSPERENPVVSLQMLIGHVAFSA